MVIYINSKKRLQIKSINFKVFTYFWKQYERFTFKNGYQLRKQTRGKN